VKFFTACLFIFISNLSIEASPLIAVASNFSHTMKEIVKLYEREHGVQLQISLGSTGSLYSQIRNGAPFDAFFSADTATVEKLSGDKLTIDSSRFTYASGKIAFICPSCKRVENWKDLARSLKGKVAIANPKLAPYGRAAKQALVKNDLFNDVASKLVYGNNIGSTYQYIRTGNSSSGFVAKSLLIADKVDTNTYQEISESDYDPIEQECIILKRSKFKNEMKHFFIFLKSKKVKDMIKTFGYKVSENV